MGERSERARIHFGMAYRRASLRLMGGKKSCTRGMVQAVSLWPIRLLALSPLAVLPDQYSVMGNGLARL